MHTDSSNNYLSFNMKISSSPLKKGCSTFTTASSIKKAEIHSATLIPHEVFLAYSPKKTTNDFKLHSDGNSLNESPQFDQSPRGDRYIPRRKLVKKESMLSEGERDLEENNGAKFYQNEGLSISDLYLRVVMTDSPRKRKENPIESFENNNILKFSSKITNLEDQSQILKESGLSWTDNVEKQQLKQRKISKVPVKVLDAPSLEDDFYLNLLDWGSQNYLSVGLSSNVYLWNANSAKVMKLCDFGRSLVTGLGWAPKDPLIAIGSEAGEVQIWDVSLMKKIRSFNGHTKRVGAIGWNSTLLSTGSRDKTILNRDLRDPNQYVSKFQGHKEEVCGLKWSPDEQQLCSGGNDNKLLVWSPKTSEPVLKFLDHEAAVKAVAWSPHQHGLLASGGGTADRTIRFRNTLTGDTTKVVEAGSQVCSLLFSRQTNELVSTHGYQLNEINLWKIPSMKKVTTLTGHTSRVLYLALSPDGNQIVTGAGDETLRFWNIFQNRGVKIRKNSSILQLQKCCLR